MTICGVWNWLVLGGKIRSTNDGTVYRMNEDGNLVFRNQNFWDRNENSVEDFLRDDFVKLVPRGSKIKTAKRKAK